MSENKQGVEAIRQLAGDHGVEVLRDILAAMGAEELEGRSA
jgi:hypothetical protein